MYYIIPLKKKTAVQVNVFVTGILRLLVTKKGPSAFPSA